VSGGAGKQLSSFSIDYLKLSVAFEQIQLDSAGLSDVRIRCDRKLVASAGWDKRVRLFGFKSLKPLAILRFHTESVHAVDFACPNPDSISEHSTTEDTKSDTTSSTVSSTSLTVSSAEQSRFTLSTSLGFVSKPDLSQLRLGMLATGSKDTRIAIYHVFDS